MHWDSMERKTPIRMNAENDSGFDDDFDAFGLRFPSLVGVETSSKRSVLSNVKQLEYCELPLMVHFLLVQTQVREM